MKKAIVFCIIVLFSLTSLTGCGSENNQSEMVTTTEAITTETEERTETYFKEARNFSDDVAWVKPEEDDSNWELINTEGEVLFTLDKGEDPTTDYKRGIAIVEESKVVDKKGNIISSMKDGTYDTIISNEFSYDGYVVVSKTTKSIEGTETKCGIIDNDGSWYHELDEKLNNPDSEVEGSMLYENWDDDDNYSYYDLKTDEFIDEDTYNKRILDRSFYDGLAFFTYEEESGAVWLSGVGTGFEIYEDRAKKIRKTGFYNTDLELVIDLSKYSFCQDLSHFQDGYCAVLLRNPDGDDFYTIIDKKGEFTFEPIGDTEVFESFSNGLIGMVSDYEITYYDIHYNMVFKKELYNNRIGDQFYCGLLKIGDYNNIYYVNTKGEIAF